MATINLTLDNLESTIENNDVILIDFWSESCGPCKLFGPIFEKVSEKYPDIVFAKCDTEEERALANHFRIMSVPTLAIFCEQVLIHRKGGMVSEEELEDLIGQVKNLDMDEVRAEMAEDGVVSGKD